MSLNDKGFSSHEYFGEGYGLLFQDDDLKETIERLRKRCYGKYVDDIIVEEFGKELCVKQEGEQ